MYSIEKKTRVLSHEEKEKIRKLLTGECLLHILVDLNFKLSDIKEETQIPIRRLRSCLYYKKGLSSHDFFKIAIFYRAHVAERLIPLFYEEMKKGENL